MLNETFTTNREKSQITILQSNSFVADAHRDNGKRFVVHAEEKLTAFLELESAIRAVQCFFLFVRVNGTVFPAAV
jgi:hypothetical protein